MNRPSDLQETLNRMAEMLPRDASAGTEERLLMAFRARRRTRRIWRYGGSAAACLALGFVWFLARHLGPATATKEAAQDSYASGTAGFVALPYAESGVPMEDTVIVRVRMQAAELGRLGVPMGPAAASGKISADLLVGQDGVARAVRLVE